MWLVTGVVEGDLSIPVPRVEAKMVSPSSMWLLLRHILLQLWLLDSGLGSGRVRDLLFWRRVFRRLRLGLGLGVSQYAANACHSVREGCQCTQCLCRLPLGLLSLDRRCRCCRRFATHLVAAHSILGVLDHVLSRVPNSVHCAWHRRSCKSAFDYEPRWVEHTIVLIVS